LFILWEIITQNLFKFITTVKSIGGWSLKFQAFKKLIKRILMNNVSLFFQGPKKHFLFSLPLPFIKKVSLLVSLIEKRTTRMKYWIYSSNILFAFIVLKLLHSS